MWRNPKVQEQSKRLGHVEFFVYFGDHKSVGDGVSAMRIDYGPGYRVYYTLRDGVLIILLAGGDKSSQAKDIKIAHELARQL